MSDFLDLTGKKSEMQIQPLVPVTPVADIPQYATLQDQLAEASLLVDDIVLKNHLTHLTDLEIIPLDDDLKKISDIRFFFFF